MLTKNPLTVEQLDSLSVGVIIVDDYVEDQIPIVAAVKLSPELWSVTGLRHAITSKELFIVSDTWKVV